MSTEEIPKKHPIDFERVQKGDYFSPAEIESITGVSQDDYKKYQFALLGLLGEFKRKLNPKFTVKTERGGLRICTDVEASPYNYAKHKRHARGIIDSWNCQKHVDISNLNSEEKKKHANYLIKMGRYVEAVKEAEKQETLHPFQQKRINDA